MSISQFFFSFTLHRVAVAALSFIASVIGARFLPSEQFSALMVAAFLAKFLHILNFGATAGYFVSRYSGSGPLALADARSERRYLTFYLLQMIGLGVLALVVSQIWLQEYRLGVIAFLLITTLFVIEPVLRYRRNFSFSLAPEFLLALALLSVLVAHLFGVANQILPAVYLVTIGVGAVVFVVLALRRRIADFRGGKDGFGLHNYARIVTLGGPVYVGTALFLVASSMDRLLLPRYGTDEQIGIYFLAHQLSVGSMILVTAINFVNTVNLGEARQDQAHDDRDMVTHKMRSAALVALGSYLALVAGVVVLEYGFLPESFDGLSIVASLLGAGVAWFYASNAITPILAYLRRQVPLSISMGFVMVAVLANNAFVYVNGLGPVWLAGGTALALVAHATFAVWFTFSVLRQQRIHSCYDTDAQPNVRRNTVGQESH